MPCQNTSQSFQTYCTALMAVRFVSKRWLLLYITFFARHINSFHLCIIITVLTDRKSKQEMVKKFPQAYNRSTNILHTCYKLSAFKMDDEMKPNFVVLIQKNTAWKKNLVINCFVSLFAEKISRRVSISKCLSVFKYTIGKTKCSW